MTKPMDKKNRRVIESMLTNALKGMATFEDVAMTSRMTSESIEVTQQQVQDGHTLFDVEKELTLKVRYKQRIDLKQYFDV